MVSPKRATPIIDKNGKKTTVHKNIEPDNSVRKAPAPTAVQESPYRFLKSPEFHNNLKYAIEYEFDSYACAGCYDNNGNDYCRDAIYENLRIESVEITSVLGYMFECPQKSLPAELVDFAEEIGVGDIESYEIETERGIYGDEVSILIDEGVHAELVKWYRDLPDAVDKAGILEYCRQRGVKTSGMTPLDAIRAQLALENPGHQSASVERAVSADVEKILLSSINVPNPKHLAEVNAGDEHTTLSDSISGVVFKDGDSYSLVDGYHRFKHAKAENKTNGTYIVLS